MQQMMQIVRFMAATIGRHPRPVNRRAVTHADAPTWTREAKGVNVGRMLAMPGFSKFHLSRCLQGVISLGR